VLNIAQVYPARLRKSKITRLAEQPEIKRALFLRFFLIALHVIKVRKPFQ